MSADRPLPPSGTFCPPSSLERKPLLHAEASTPKKAILVTGATGYIGSRVVERLLAAGHDVHVLARARRTPDPEDVLAYLQALPGAAQHLTVVTGDVTDAASLRAAMTGCQQLVHLAAVVDIREPPDAASRQRMVDTALNGTRMVLDASTAAGSITKVILASSIVAIMWDWWERGRQHVYTEEDWTLDSSVAHNCYAYCKRESERLAYELAQGQRWELATINPGIVFGPVACRKLAASASVWQPIVQHMNGTKFPFTSSIYVSHVDLDDVAAAVCGLLGTPGATGRYMLMSGPPPSMLQIAHLLRLAHPQAPVAWLNGPTWAVSLLATFCSQQLGFDIRKLRAMHNKPYVVDASKVQRVLPDLSYIPLRDSARAAADCVVGLGFVSMQWTPRLRFLNAVGRLHGWLWGQADPLEAAAAPPAAAAAAGAAPAAAAVPAAATAAGAAQASTVGVETGAGGALAAARVLPANLMGALANAAAARHSDDADSDAESVSSPVGVDVIVCGPLHTKQQQQQQQQRRRLATPSQQQAV